MGKNDVKPKTMSVEKTNEARAATLFGSWVSSNDKPHPDKPGKERYEQIPCLVVHRGEIMIRQWNCEHLVWDGEDGDDFFCRADAVTHWMPLPPLPDDQAWLLCGT